jgi:D-alanyl-D-alanine carboxypeptidase (penicillin-binding protein 5/6)
LAVRYSVLTPVTRGGRRRRWRPLALLVLAVFLAFAAFAGSRHFRNHSAPAAAAAPPPKPRHHAHVLRPPPLALLSTLSQPLQGRPPVTSSSAILVDATTGDVLWQKRPHERKPIASTTKIMTAAVVLERLQLERVIKVAPGVPRTPLVREGLRAGEHVAVWKLLDGLLLYSGNDDALALAIGAAGSRPRFLDLMNEKARDLGLHDTHFTSVSGVIDRGNYSSAWDLAALTRYALRDPRFRRIVATKVVHVRWSAPTFEKVYVNKNKLLGTYRGADGVKTGWTTLAAHCLVASATRGHTRLIAVLLHSTNPYGDARRLLNLGFALRR